jgi:hypothetical protein
MSCRRICRELLWLARFGQLGPSSQPHLDHLVGCRACRDEVGFDREMVRQLRVALAERIDGLQPSSTAWEGILRRAQAPEPTRLAAWWQRSMGLVVRLRTATAMAGTGLALVLALQMEVMPLMPPASPADSARAQGEAAAPIPASERGNRAILQVTPAQPHPEAVIALPLARADLQPAGRRIPDAPPGELVTLELTFRSSAPPEATLAAEEVSEPEPEAEPSPVDPGLAS